jgi:cysteine desulfurase
VRGDELAAALDLEGISVSSGSACSAGTAEPSPVIQAMLGPDRARSAIRVSLGEDTSDEDVERLLSVLPALLGRAEPRRSSTS